ncbi:type IV secretion system protein DotC [Legionella qingyii]|uniref:Type IV secretion system protein DotC n=1 Tax=Legionella qingyii TaxID=2184757 RepID=A0A317TYI0_9GAMM|nr:type IV secretion system DotC family protein [Legionella qingyii]PWY54684.1 type IV secretion system protein DotC [Legionella qingyii]RUR20412.1 type IV secretion system protein DotC [Legionella qingyii]RUR29409.1 type IV secretion system protein DotC [Legionella qingyii]
MPKFIPSLIVVVLSALLLACHSSKNMGDTGSLEGLQAMANVNVKQRNKKQNGKIRQMALKETALSLGAQAGLAWRAKVIDEHLIKQSRRLDAIYDFNSLILEHNILPPVLLEGRNTLNLADAQTIRISDRTYRVAKQAHFVTTPPTWRQYLWLDYVKPEYPHYTLLPKTKVEKKIWCIYTAKGWKNGIDQANTILEENIARIKEDFGGMILYRKLLAMNMVTPPYVSHTDLGITGDASEIHIDDRVLRITALPALNINSEQWRAAVSKDENALEQFKNMEKLANRSKIIITDKSWQPTIAPINDNNRIH